MAKQPMQEKKTAFEEEKLRIDKQRQLEQWRMEINTNRKTANDTFKTRIDEFVEVIRQKLGPKLNEPNLDQELLNLISNDEQVAIKYNLLIISFELNKIVEQLTTQMLYLLEFKESFNQITGMLSIINNVFEDMLSQDVLSSPRIFKKRMRKVKKKWKQMIKATSLQTQVIKKMVTVLPGLFGGKKRTLFKSKSKVNVSGDVLSAISAGLRDGKSSAGGYMGSPSVAPSKGSDDSFGDLPKY